MNDFALLIVLWYRQNKRDLPWRNTRNPYYVWLSEIILQQTRVAQGMAYYHAFVEKYPTVDMLAQASEQEVLRLWQGLGYYSRARNLHFSAQKIVNEFGGEFPSNYKDIKSLKGVGDYTAAAIASFAFNLPYAVVDGNVYRVLSRYFNDATPIDTTEGKKVFQAYADELLDNENPAEFNQAIMELGALVCKPTQPNCEVCPLVDSCLAAANDNYYDYPVKSKKTKVTKRYFNYFLLKDGKVYLEKRTQQDIWKNMYQFPLLETPQKWTKRKLYEFLEEKHHVKLVKRIDSQKHILSHQIIEAEFWLIDKQFNNEELIITDLIGIEKYPLPRLIERFIEDNYEIFN